MLLSSLGLNAGWLKHQLQCYRKQVRIGNVVLQPLFKCGGLSRQTGRFRKKKGRHTGWKKPTWQSHQAGVARPALCVALVCGSERWWGQALQLLPCGCKSSRREPSPGCLPLRPRLTTPRRCTELHSLTWEDKKEHQMFFVLLTLCVSGVWCCVCVSVLSVLHCVFSTVQPAVDYLLQFHSPLSVMLCQECCSPQHAFYLFGAPPGLAVL